MEKFVFSVFLIVVSSFVFATGADQKVKLKWKEVSAFNLYLGNGTLTNFQKNDISSSFNQSMYETDFGPEETLILFEDKKENRLYFSANTKKLSSFSLHNCLIKIKGITIGSRHTYLDVLEELNIFEISTNIPPTKNEKGSIWLRLAPSTDEYLIFDFSNGDSRLERCRTWLDN